MKKSPNKSAKKSGIKQKAIKKVVVKVAKNNKKVSLKPKKLSAVYSHEKIEKKWQKAWQAKKVYETKDFIAQKNKTDETDSNEKDGKSQKKFYILDMFPYPSGEGLHVGHPKGYIATDVISRMKRMQGYNVLHPMGFDAFGLPAENYAIKTKTNPVIAVKKNVDRYKKQLAILGFDYDWSREVNTTDPKYYKWTQWIFLKLLEKGLAYESYEPINWCPSCKTGLANEDVEDGKCERCSTVVVKKPMRQWVLKITDYADRLLYDLDAKKKSGSQSGSYKPSAEQGTTNTEADPESLLLDWPTSIKESQRNWIGRSEGVNFKCKIKDLDIKVEMFNSVPQTYHAETFTAIAADHPLLPKLVKGTPREKEVLDFASKIIAKKASLGASHDVTNPEDFEGIFTGRYIESFADTGKDLPIWVASYVLSDYGTGIVNCSAHDERDFAFAKKYNIPLHPVMFPLDPVVAEKVENLEICYAKDPEGVISEPTKFKGRKWGEVRGDIITHIESAGFGTRKVNYKIKDWVFSRQRYWGEPIPVIHCEACLKAGKTIKGTSVVAVPEKDLPVILPKVKSYEPTGTGESPLAAISSWVNVKCPQCGGKAKRETNTMPQWAGSCWYYLRYIDPKNAKSLVDKEKEATWSPVDIYVGGAEHATRHLIYARFWHKFLYDIGVVSYIEPFITLRSVGLIMGEDGRKMSKRFGNVVNPDEIVKLYGADTLRVYEMFMGPFDQSIKWNTDSMIGSRRFIERIWNMAVKVLNQDQNTGSIAQNESAIAEKTLHKAIKKVTEDISTMRYNTAVSTLMITLNELEKTSVDKNLFTDYIKLCAPFAPHLADEIWSIFGHNGSIHTSEWPKYDESKIVDDLLVITLQVNGKVRGQMSVPKDTDDITLENLAKKNESVEKWISGKSIRRVIVVKGRLVNIVVSE